MSIAECAHSPSPPSRFFPLKKVLVVEQDDTCGRAMAAALEEAGYYPNRVRDAAEARRRVFERHYDLVVLATSVGPEALQGIFREMLKHGYPPQVLLMAGMDEEIAPERVESIPALSVLRHPCTAEDVIDAVKALLGSPFPDDRT